MAAREVRCDHFSQIVWNYSTGTLTKRVTELQREKHTHKISLHKSILKLDEIIKNRSRS